jgi:hypothetical protein
MKSTASYSILHLKRFAGSIPDPGRFDMFFFQSQR